MKALPRRGFLKLLSATPFAGRMVADQAAASLANVSIAGLDPNAPPSGVPSSSNEPTKDAIAQGLRNPTNRAALMDMLWEDERTVSRIDPDLAVMRSFSLNAKIAFQRQRNVERRFEATTKEYPWRRMDAFLRKITSPF
ncbi:MAG: hypothetical protein ACOYOJ_21210 [Alsobacter sp.]